MYKRQILVQAIAFADASMSATLSSPVGSIEIIESKRLAALHPNEVARESYRSHQVSSALAARILAAVGELSNPVSVSYTHLDVYKRQNQYGGACVAAEFAADD